MRNPTGIAIAGAAGLVVRIDEGDLMAAVEERVSSGNSNDSGSDDRNVH
jgi:hypothetical protein